MQFPILIGLHEISFLTKWNIFSSVSGPSLITIYFQYPEMKRKVLFHCGRFNRWNFISGYKNYVCVCVCVFMLFHLLASSGCTTSVIYVRGRINDLLLWALRWVLLPSPIISVSEPILFHLQRRKLQPAPDWRKNEWYNAAFRKEDILI